VVTSRQLIVSLFQELAHGSKLQFDRDDNLCQKKPPWPTNRLSGSNRTRLRG
jgi:hypothetical protein